MNQISQITNKCFAKQKLNILTSPVHERFQSNWKDLPHTFYLTHVPNGKTWDDTYAKLPKNHILIPKGQELPDYVDIDLVISQNKFDAYSYFAPIAQQYKIPLISIEHTAPVPNWPIGQIEYMKKLRGDINVFITDWSREKWGWSENECNVIYHGIDTEVFKPKLIEKKEYILSVVNDFRNRDWCQPAGQKIWTTIGFINIENIKVGHQVLTDSGLIYPVIKIFERDYFGDLISIKLSNFNTVKFTPEHNIKVFRDNRWLYIDASRLRKGDKLKYPKHVQTDFTFSNLDQAWLIGLIIGDGSITKKGNISITFHIDDNKIAEKAISVFESMGLNAKISNRDRKRAKIFTVESINIIFGNWLKSHILSKSSKKIPDFIMNGSDLIRLAVLQGLWSADGSFKNGIKKHGNRACYSTVSPRLAAQVSNLLHSFGIRCSVTRQKRTTNKSNGKELPIYRIISTGEDNFEKCKNLIENSVINEPYSYEIMDINIEREWSGKVYNCEVLQDPSYIVYPGFVSHNCCGFNIWKQIVDGLPWKHLGKDPGFSEPAKSIDDLVFHHNEAFLFLNTSTVSPIPMSLMEAMSSGTACVSTNTCDIPKVIKHGYNGLLGNNVEELKAHCVLLLKNAKLREELGRNARKTIEEKFSLRKFTESWNYIIEKAYSIKKN